MSNPIFYVNVILQGRLVGRGKYFELVKLPIIVNLSDFVRSEVE